jgi:tetratricopeptide (TPR) repeat protein
MRVQLLLALPVAALAMALPAAAQSKKGAPSTANTPTGHITGAAKADAMVANVFDNLTIVTDMHFHKGEYNHIVNLGRMIVAAQPDNVDVYATSAWLLWSMDRDTEAVALYEQGAKANPKTWYMFDELGHYYYNRKKDYPRAVGYYEKAAACIDCPPPTLHMLAHAYEKTKQFNKALDVWKRALDNDSTGSARTNYERVKRLVAANGSK